MWLRRIAIASALALFFTVFLTGCDNRPCVRGHYDYVPIWHTAGKIHYMSITPVWNCDEYGPEPKKTNG